MGERPTFQDELEALINRHSMENMSNTPDFILAGYLMACLDAWQLATRAREKWYGYALRPCGESGPITEPANPPSNPVQGGGADPGGDPACWCDRTTPDENGCPWPGHKVRP